MILLLFFNYCFSFLCKKDLKKKIRAHFVLDHSKVIMPCSKNLLAGVSKVSRL